MALNRIVIAGTVQAIFVAELVQSGRTITRPYSDPVKCYLKRIHWRFTKRPPGHESEIRTFWNTLLRTKVPDLEIRGDRA